MGFPPWLSPAQTDDKKLRTRNAAEFGVDQSQNGRVLSRQTDGRTNPNYSMIANKISFKTNLCHMFLE